ncbi:MAG TPA: CARDB domain-containing protein [Bryobacteraceae bacterium]|nr:CARDB domain-containing protein [Bryobacteraceae bacterium]
MLELHAEWRTASGRRANVLRENVARALEERAGLLKRLLAEDPDRAAAEIFPPEVASQLHRDFAPSAQFVESYGTWQGVIEHLIEDDFDRGTARSIIRLRTSGEVLVLHGRGALESELRGGRSVLIRGMRLGDRVLVTGVSAMAGAAAAAGCSTTGAQNTVAILVETPSYKLPAGVDPDQVRGILFGNQYTSKTALTDYSVDDFWRQNSDGQTWLPFSGSVVVGPFLLSRDYDKDATGAPYCDEDGLLAEALSLADAQVYFPLYSRILLVIPNLPSCRWAGLAQLGCWASHPQDGGFTATVAWQKGVYMTDRATAVKLTTHELGHNLGMDHASSREFTTGGVRVPLGPFGDPGTLDEYGDRFSTMGSWNLGFYNAHHAAGVLGWLRQGTHYVEVQSAGTYTLEPYEQRPFGLKALKIRRGAGSSAWLWVEYRQNLGIYDSTLGSQVFTGALIHYQDSTTGLRTHLLDFTPSDDWSQVALAAGQSWQDPYSSLRLTVLAATSSGLTINVTYVSYALNLTKNQAAGGTVTSSPAGINCGTSCGSQSASFSGGTTVTLTATAAGGWQFSGWSGCDSASGTTCTVNMNANRSVTADFTSSPPLPDLAVSSFVTSASGVAGSQIHISVTVRNQGAASSAPFQIGFYYSSDAAITTSDVSSGWVCNYPGGLAAGSSGTCTGLIAVPPSLAPGVYYAGAIVDDSGVVAESDESNNSRPADNGTTYIVSPRAPVAVSATPAAGTGTSQIFQFTFSDPDGWNDLAVVNILINFWLDARQACYLAYVPASRSVLLVNDAGDAGGPYQGMTLPSGQTIGNSQCTVNGAQSGVAESGEALTLTLAIGFQAGFGGTKVVYLAARDTAGNNSGWQRLGVWSVPVSGQVSPAVLGTPTPRGSGAGPVSLTFQFSDADGWQDLDVANVLINDWLDGRYGCYLAYSRPLGVLYLVNDSGTALLPGLTPGSSATVNNTQCTVYGSGSSASGSGGTLTLTLRIELAPTFSGNRVLYAAARDMANHNSGWQAAGTWTVP